MTRLLLPRRRRPLLALALMLTAGACADQPAAPPAAGGPRLSAGGGTLPRPTLVSAHIPYRGPRYTPATGRSGSASLTTRALLGRDGTTELDVTTGYLDPFGGAWGPGTLTRVQTKGFDPTSGKLMATHNHNEPAGGGAAVFSYGGLARGAVLQVQGSVRGIDPNRTDVVTVTDTVRLRPNLAVTEVVVPERVRAGRRVNIAATIRETNGDVGAGGYCHLYVDGEWADVGWAWVAAGDAVTCAFSHVFHEEGRHRLEVTLGHVAPRDDFAGDDAAAAETEAFVSNDLFYSLGVSQSRFREARSWEERWRFGDAGGEFTSREEWEGTEWTVALQAWMPRGVQERPVRLEVSEETDGVAIASGAYAVELTEWWGDATCGSGWDEARQVYVHVCAADSWTQLDYSRFAGSATYHSREYQRTWDGLSGEEWVYTSNGHSARDWGLPVPLGSTYALHARLFDGEAVFAANPLALLRDGELSNVIPRECQTYEAPELSYFYQTCRDYGVFYQTRFGSASG